nr:immunoglobulin heavy chain junction region [Homo sapiens]MBN4570966.1 immunoglobulin heavy chain junction region [Homo sapiens]
QELTVSANEQPES